MIHMNKINKFFKNNSDVCLNFTNWLNIEICTKFSENRPIKTTFSMNRLYIWMAL